jgi:hypothetical protein
VLDPITAVSKSSISVSQSLPSLLSSVTLQHVGCTFESCSTWWSVQHVQQPGAVVSRRWAFLLCYVWHACRSQLWSVRSVSRLGHVTAVT